MPYATDEILQTLRGARELSGLSQRDLSARIGVPQSHISKIESGATDLRLSSLVEFARALDYELFLVPRKTLPAVEAHRQQRFRHAQRRNPPAVPGISSRPGSPRQVKRR